MMVPAQRGFTYLGLLFAVALAGVALAATGMVWSTERQREREKELLFVGGQFRKAIASYYERSPGLVKRYPTKLEDLLKDGRFLTVRRHLTQVYLDPMTGTRNWVLIPAPEGGIMGIFSTSTAASIKRAGFASEFSEFEGKNSYAEWRFVYRPAGTEIPSPNSAQAR
ncbi:MAG: type II secretion system protein [Sulfuricella sp.]|nr:type II secretion system protein [Sulfuricella sp.]